MSRTRAPRILAVAVVCLTLTASLQSQDRALNVLGTPNNQVRVLNSYPEYRVDGKPFFMHASAFFYHRIPRDRWAEELLRLKSMGINTIDLYPFWNWHQPTEDLLDFDGRTSPRRDLKYLLRLIEVLGFKLTFRPGPFFCSEWRNGGYPDWLLRRPEYGMSEQTVLEGRYPRLSALQYDKSEQAAAEWLDNGTHLRHTRQWYEDVLSLVNPLLAGRGGPVLSIQLDDDQAIGFENYNGPDFWKYMDLLRKYAKEATNQAKIPYYLNGRDMRVNAEANDATAEPLWNTGQDYMDNSPAGYSTTQEAAKNKFLTEILKTEPLFVPTHIEFQAGWLLSEKDTYAMPTDPSNTLMATRVMFQNGLKGLNYYPLNDTLYPAGYEAQWGNHFYSWEAAVNYAGKETGRAVTVRRNGRLLEGMGPLLGASHLLVDAGLVYPMATFPQAELSPAEANYIASFTGRVLWSGAYDHFNFELVDSDHTPLDNFKRYRILLLPNLASGKTQLKQFPHLERYSEKAQRMIADYVASGGTLIVFPSLPKGDILGELLAPLGKDQLQLGDTTVRFSDGTAVRALGSRRVLTLPKKPRGDVKVFARDSRGGVVGACFTHGEGQVLFFGADFSRWTVPPMAIHSPEQAGGTAVRDYPEEVQKAARMALPALMREAGVQSKAYPEMESGKARDLGLYVTELIADWDSRPFEQRTAQRPGYAFVAVTNFSVEEARSAEIVLTDPRVSDLSSAAPAHYLRLPRLTLPPRESMMLPVRLPLNNRFWELAPGLEESDEVYYATAELSRVAYDGTTLRLEFTAPSEGEVALRLAERPRDARVDGQAAPIQEDTSRRLFIVKIPKGAPPHFVRTVDLGYPREGPGVAINTSSEWIAGETRAVRVRVENPYQTAFEGELDFVAGRIYKPDNPPLPIHIPVRSSREFSFPVEIPPEAVEGQAVDLVATLREQNATVTWAWRSQVIIHHPFQYDLGPVLYFPLREDQSIPIVRPLLAALDLPGEAILTLRVKNWHEHEEVVTLAAEGADLDLNPSSAQLVLPPLGETTVTLRAAPAKGSGVYRFEIRLRAGPYQVKEGVVLAALREGEVVAYGLDYDRDGFDDVILENRSLRCFVSPHAGGRAFAFARKESNTNAFNSVGGMRDSFTARFEPEDMKGLPAWTNANWLGLYNRPYSFRIISSGGAQAEVRFEYVAPDIYPKGVSVERSLVLAGNQSAVIASTTVTPHGIEKPQAYVLENSVPFRSFDKPIYSQWFAPGRPAEDFIPQKRIELGVRTGYLGTLNKETGETFALMLLSPAERSQLVVEDHSALLRAIYPAFGTRNQPYNYRVAYYFGKEPPQEIESVFGKLRTGK